MITKLKHTLNEHGVCNGMLYLFTLALARLNSPLRILKYGLFIQPVPNQALLPPRQGANISIRLIDADEYRYEWFERPAEVVDQRYRQGAVCFVAFHNETPVGCIWLCLGRYLEDEVKCCFVMCPEDRVAWDFDVYIAPKYRYGRTFLYLWDAAYSWLRGQGVQWTASRIDVLNIASLKAHKRLDAKQIGALLFLSGPAWQLMLADVPPYFHFSTTVGHLPDIKVGPRYG